MAARPLLATGTALTMASGLLALPGAANLAAAAAAAQFDGPQWWGVVVLLGWLVWLALQSEGPCIVSVVKCSADKGMGPATSALPPAGCTGGRRASNTHPPIPPPLRAGPADPWRLFGPRWHAQVVLRTFGFGASAALLWMLHVEPLELLVGGLAGGRGGRWAVYLLDEVCCWLSRCAASCSTWLRGATAAYRIIDGSPAPTPTSCSHPQSWEDVYFFCGARYQHCTAAFRWNIRHGGCASLRLL